MGGFKTSRTVAMPVAVIPPTERAAGPGATLASSSFTPIAQSPAYPAYSHMHIVIEVEEKAQRYTRGCAACLRAGCLGCAKALVGAVWAVVRWVLGITANTAVKIAVVLAIVGACYYEYLLNTGKVTGVHDPKLKQYLYGAFLDLFRSAKQQVEGSGGSG